MTMTALPAGPDSTELATAQEVLARCRSALGALFVGQEDLVQGVLAAVAASGHVLVESVPGLGKTLLVKAVGRILGLDVRRIQFTPDLMPSDITGAHLFDLAERRFVFHPGPVFAQFLLADELNRAPAKTHAALLEAMQEGQVTLDGKRFPITPPFLVLATQNPIENEGTYALPEAALDRFLLKLTMTYPGAEDEVRILTLHLAGSSPERILADQVQPVTDAAGVLALQRTAARILVEPAIVDYAARIVRRTRGWPGLVLGAGPRAGIAILATARALALMRGRAFVVPDDVADAAPACLRHRVILSPEAEVEGRTTDTVVAEVIRSEPVPRGTGTIG
jgi:MoxR-like ATPase